jgi:EAL domain.
MLDPETLAQLYYQIGTNSQAAKQLCFEVRESTSTRFPDEFSDFCTTRKAKACRICLTRVCESFSQLLDVQEMGLDYV